MLFPGDGPAELFVKLPASGINIAIADHLKMFFRDMADQTLDKFHNRNGFFHIFVILMTVVMKCDKIAVIAVNAGSGDDGTTKIAADVFQDGRGITFIGFCIDVKAVFVLFVTARFLLFKGRSDFGFQFIEQSGTEGITEEGVVKMMNIAPETVIAVTALRNEAVNVRIPF